MLVLVQRTLSLVATGIQSAELKQMHCHFTWKYYKSQGNNSDKFPSLSLHHMSTLDHIVRKIYIASHK